MPTIEQLELAIEPPARRMPAIAWQARYLGTRISFEQRMTVGIACRLPLCYGYPDPWINWWGTSYMCKSERRCVPFNSMEPGD